MKPFPVQLVPVAACFFHVLSFTYWNTAMKSPLSLLFFREKRSNSS